MKISYSIPLPSLLTIGVPAALLAAASAAPGQRQKPAARKDSIPARVQYNRDVRPILADNCFQCHGPDSGTRKANLRLDTEQGARAMRGSYAAVIPGHPEKSALIARVTAGNSPLVMPPATFKSRPSGRDIEILKRWIAQGAKYETHWAYQPIVRPPVPPLPKPDASIRNPIDHFLISRMAKEGLKPSPEADRRTLIRRLSLDLTGLPPKPEDVNRFLQDRRPDAYERLVDQYLASPHFGERMAVWWLDLVRYADTVGYHGDQDVTVWPYRDYVIRAFNADKPFDQFTREQLAGDLLPNRTEEQLVASGYNRLGMMSTEGGVQDKEYRAKYAAERIRNLSTTWMGSTTGCAECHDHKYDPFSARDFYQLQAFFADIKEKGFYDGGFGTGDWGPSMKLLTPAQKSALEQLDRDVESAKKALAAVPDAQLEAGRLKWEAEVRAMEAEKRLGWRVLKPNEAVSTAKPAPGEAGPTADATVLNVQPDGSVFVSGEPAAFETYTLTVPAPEGRIAALRLEPQGDERLPGNGIARSGYYFALSDIDVAVEQGGRRTQIPISHALVAVEDEGYPVRAAIDGLPQTAWAPGFNARTHGQPAVFHLGEPLESGPDSKLVVRLHFGFRPRLSLGRFRILASSVEQAALGGQGVPDNVLAAIRKNPTERSPQEAAAIAAHYRSVAPELSEQRLRLAALETMRSIERGRVPQTLITETVPPRAIRILPRGNWMDDSGEVVQPKTPHFLQQIQKAARPSRLDLADWVVSRKNPLTSRVIVNRLWKLFYGVGLSKNVEDFGVQGEPPMHPELLDWLATAFMEGPEAKHGSGHAALGTRNSELGTRRPWSLKRLVRRMVTSRTYRQSSAASPALIAKDPFNRFYARQSAPRLEAEFIRDVALSAAGMLSARIGGESVRPYGPRGYLASLNFPRREWAADTGEDLYRRGLYTFWQRTFLHPSLLAFDAATREECTTARTVSNTPMQALTLMNDPIFVEASRVLGERIVRNGGATFESKLAYAFERAVSRKPLSIETDLLRKLYQRSLARYRADASSARKAVAEGEWPVAKDLNAAEVAAWSIVARAVLNLHETITRS